MCQKKRCSREEVQAQVFADATWLCLGFLGLSEGFFFEVLRASKLPVVVIECGGLLFGGPWGLPGFFRGLWALRAGVSGLGPRGKRALCETDEATG